jgi:serine/threonine protein kinase
MGSKQMDLEGTITDLDVFYEGRPIFRKYVSLSWGMNELEIAKQLLISPLKHCVTIYHVMDTPCLKYIDMEILSFPSKRRVLDAYLHDVYCGLNELHNEKIIYIDLKTDNIGYSDKDGCWKLFDFDCSGTCTSEFDQWIIKPPYYYAYKSALKYLHQLEDLVINVDTQLYTFKNLLEIDQIGYKLFQEELMK